MKNTQSSNDVAAERKSATAAAVAQEERGRKKKRDRERELEPGQESRTTEAWTSTQRVSETYFLYL